MKKKVGKKLEKSWEKSWKKIEKKNKKKVGKKLFFFQFFFSTHHPDQMLEGSRVSKVTICVRILKSARRRRRRRRRPRVGIELPGQLKKLEEASIFENRPGCSQDFG